MTHLIGDFWCCLQASEKAAANVTLAALPITGDYVPTAVFDAAFVGLPAPQALRRIDIALGLWDMTLDVEVIGAIPTPVYRCSDMSVWGAFLLFTVTGGQECERPCPIKRF
jgi:hypothetical protein